MAALLHELAELMLFVYIVSDGGGGSNVERDLTQDAWSSSDEDDWLWFLVMSRALKIRARAFDF